MVCHTLKYYPYSEAGFLAILWMIATENSEACDCDDDCEDFVCDNDDPGCDSSASGGEDASDGDDDES